MSEYRLNKINFKILNPKIKIWISENQLSNFQFKKIELFNELDIPTALRERPGIYFSFKFHPEATEVDLNLETKKYFLKPYVDFHLTNHFEEKKLTIRKTFIQSIQCWKYISQESKAKIYDRISVRQLGTMHLHKLELLISYDGKSLVSSSPLSDQKFASQISKYFQENKIYETRVKPISNESETFPILSLSMRKDLSIPFEGFASKNTYLEYYKKISVFYDTYLKGQSIAENITFYSEGFEEVDEMRIMRTKKVSNYLKFNGNNDYSISNGLKKFGPYKVPPTDNLRFIFIYKNNEIHRKAANQLYIALKNGLESNFPGLKDYVKVNFELAQENKIILETNDPGNELVNKLEHYIKQEGLKYFAIYLTDHKRFDDLENNEDEYYKVKYALLQKEILSQFIYYKNIDTLNFKYHLPNIAVAILAKLGGIPWKLDTVTSAKMIVGFGVKRLDDSTYLGNTLCFKDDGEFYKFETYQRANIQTIGEALRDSINNIIIHEHFIPDKLIIHYYKTLSDEEAHEIENVLKEVNLSIPFIVLTINDTKSKDYLFFDVASKDIMPVSGTIIEIKNKTEYLLANNERHSETQLYSIRKFPFPLKIKVNKPNNTLYDVFDIKELIDQVYSFSRIYWKSINQVSLPVTIAYSKIVADLAAHFPEHCLPDQDIAHSNLWFL
jgi:hypothetical protein